SCTGNCPMTGAEAANYVASAVASMMASGASPAGVKVSFDGKNINVTMLANVTGLSNANGMADGFVDDTVNGNGTARGMRVNVEHVHTTAAELEDQGFVPGSIPALFSTNRRSPNGGALVQQVHMDMDESGDPVNLGYKSDYAEAWIINKNSVYSV